jgi:diketogulonate reductase-like aldo/keto reductase
MMIRTDKVSRQVCLRWACQRGYTIVPKSSNEGRLTENLSLFDFELTDDEMKSISALNKNRRYNGTTALDGHASALSHVLRLDPGYFCEGAFKQFYPIH